MPSIPTGSFDAEKIALELYDNEEIRGPFFAAAYERFPDYNDEQLYDAAEYIQDRFTDECSGPYSEEQWQKICDALFDSIIAGLN